MANRLSSLPWLIDTASGTDVWTGYICIAHFELVDYSLDTDEVIVHDKNGRIVWHANGAADLQPVASEYVGVIQGLRVPTLTTGATLLVFIE